MLTLYRALQGAKKAAAIANIGLNPILRCVHIASKGDSYIVQASNGYYVARYTIEAHNPSPINVCILAKDLTRLPSTRKADISVLGDVVTINGSDYPRYTGDNWTNGVYIDLERYWPQEWASTTLYSIAALTSQLKTTTGDIVLMGATLDPAYVALALKHIPGKVVRVSANGKLGPLLFEGDGAQWLIMPIRT